MSDNFSRYVVCENEDLGRAALQLVTYLVDSVGSMVDEVDAGVCDAV